METRLVKGKAPYVSQDRADESLQQALVWPFGVLQAFTPPDSLECTASKLHRSVLKTGVSANKRHKSCISRKRRERIDGFLSSNM